MRSLLIFLSSVALFPLTGAMIGPVEYELPKTTKGWKLGNEIKGKEKDNKTVIYIPENTNIDDGTAQEVFGVTLVNKPSKAVDQDSLVEEIRKGFLDPKPAVTVKILEKTTDSVLFEWTVRLQGEKGKMESMHGWNRIFLLPDQTVLLSFWGEDTDKLKEIQPVALQAIKDAKIAKK